jgi:hypothetical protein
MGAINERALRRVYGEAEGEEHEYLSHDTICAMTVNAQVSAKTTPLYC